MSNSKGCTFCIRHGLPILPVRPALMENTEVLPVLPASIKMPTPAQGDTAYNARLLRDGYLYVYDEMVKSWLDYYVTAEGYYYPLPTKGPVPPDLAQGKVKPCADQPAELARASLITLPVMPTGKKNGIFWFSWSQAQWTDATRKKHEDASYRAQYMQRFDMDAWIKSKRAENVVALSTLATCVAEYSPKANAATVKNWSHAPWKNLKPLEATNIISAADALYAGHGAIMVLQDPVAMAQDIAWLANYRINKHFNENPAYTRGLALTNAVSWLKESTCAQYRRDIVFNNQVEELNTEIGYDMLSGMPVPGSAAMSAVLHENNVKMLETRVENKWQSKYGKYYDEGKQKAFTTKFNSALDDYDKRVIVPMMKMYLVWLGSEVMTHYFQHNFDTTNTDSGILYVQSATDCIDGVQDKLLVSKHLQTQLLAACTDKNNFISRAAVFNNDRFAEKINTSVRISGDVTSLPWDKIFDGFKDIFDQKIAGAQLALEKFQSALSGAVYSLVEKVINSKPADALVAFAVVSNKQIKVITLTASRKDFVSAVVNELAQTFGVSGRAGIDQLRHYVQVELRHMEAQGIKLTGTQVSKFAVLADIREGGNIPSTPGAARAAAIASTLRSAEEVKATIFPNTFRNKLAQLQGSSPQAISTSALKSLPFAGSVLSASFQTYAIVHAGLPKEFTVEASSRFAANITMAVGAIADSVERLLNDFKSVRWKAQLRIGMGGNVQRFIMSSLKWIKWLGGAAGIVGAAFDFYSFVTEANKGHVDIAVAYLCSSLGGGILAVAVILNVTLAPVWIVIAVVLFFGSAIYLALNIKNDVQLWLMSCLWRKIPTDEKEIPPIWPTSSMEMAEFNKALTSGAQ